LRAITSRFIPLKLVTTQWFRAPGLASGMHLIGSGSTRAAPIFSSPV
jgi:hypothetical protein